MRFFNSLMIGLGIKKVPDDYGAETAAPVLERVEAWYNGPPRPRKTLPKTPPPAPVIQVHVKNDTKADIDAMAKRIEDLMKRLEQTGRYHR